MKQIFVNGVIIMRKAQLKLGAALTVYIGLAFYASVTHAITLSQQPLFLTSGAEANIMFILDDSGSMTFEVTPEKYRQTAHLVNDGNNDGVVYLFPPALGLYGTNTDYGDVPAPGEYLIGGVQNVYGKLLRSKVNSSYYDPSKRYIPWVGVDGTLMSNASPTCALHNPRRTGTGDSRCRNLTVNGTNTFNSKTWRVHGCRDKTNCGSTTNSTTYFPATYWWFTGNVNTEADVWDNTKYTKQEIKPATPPAIAEFTGHGRGEKRTDCTVTGSGPTATASCNYDQEIQNFANWYTYYRSRVLLARAGIGRAFSEQQESIRVGFGAINKDSADVDGEDTVAIIRGVRTFNSSEKENFLKALYDRTIDGGTPLLKALDAAGKYYSRDDNKGPWSKTPGTEDSSPHVECRASYTMLMSDGYWSGGSTNVPAGIGNQDNTSGSQITNHINNGEPATYTYTPSAPFADDHSSMLADVAMQYWKTDLRPTLANKVKPNTVDPAFWQHMTTFTIGLGVTGSLPPIDIPTAIANQTNIPWPSVNAGSTTDDGKIDDLIHAAVNGRGDFFSAQEPDEFSESMANMLNALNEREQNNAAAAAANSTSLTSGSVVYRASFDSKEWIGRLVAKPINPDGSYGADLWTASIPAASTRNIFTYNPDSTTGVAFNWASLNTDQKNSISTTNAQAIVNWVRGQTDVANLRARTSLLGDIVNSGPVYAGRENMGFSRLSADQGGASYAAYYTTHKENRREVIYVGANDGMLHAFDATLSTPAEPDTKVDGEEVFAYIPSSMLGKFDPSDTLSKFERLSSPTYGKNNTNLHRYFVDGQMFVSDAYVRGEWRNLLVGTLGGGGRGIYVLDVTDPDSFSEDDVLFELTEANYPELGNIMGTPFIAPGKDDGWKIYVGNGYNSSKDGAAKGFLGIIDINFELGVSGSTPTKFIATNTDAGNALSQPALLPDTKGTIVAAYAGDVLGNLWKFDLSNTNSDSWARAYGSTPLFVAAKGAYRQPITASPTLGFNTSLSPARVMVYFGTGRYAAATDAQVSTDAQSFYAIADKGVTVAGRAKLHQKTISTESTSTKRIIDGEVTSDGTNAVPWSTVSGWYLDFPANERIIVKPQLYYDRLIFPTVIPSEDPCLSGGSTWVMELIAVGNTDLTYRVLGELGNEFESVLILSPPTMLIGTKQRDPSSKSSASSSSAASSDGQCGSGTMINVMTDINDESQDKKGVRPCPLYNRQSWRELEN